MSIQHANCVIPALRRKQIELPTTGNSTVGTANPTIAGIQFRSDGTLYRSNNVGSYVTLGVNWLIWGSSADVWIERVLVANTLNSSDPGAGRLQLSTTRTFAVQDTTTVGGAITCTLYFQFWSASSGGLLLGQTANLLLSAERAI